MSLFRRTFQLILIAVIISGSISAQEFRDPYRWPFAKNSIWNTPIGSDAEYKAQPINPDHIDGIMIDGAIIIMTPDAPLMNLYGTKYRWSPGTNIETRCKRYNNTVHEQLPIPDSYNTQFFGTKPNNMATILKANGRSIFQTMPFQVCDGGYATTGLKMPGGEPINVIMKKDDIDIFSDGRIGSHGGSGLSSIGGAIRMGELSPGAGPIKHALKISFPCEHYLFYDHDIEKGYRWPAVRHDAGAAKKYNGTEPEAMIGCLRAIPADIHIDSLGLETEPGKKIAWTLQNYGAYQVEEVPWARMMIVAEEGPEGNVPDEFKEDWGYDFISLDKAGNPWFRDMIKIMEVLHIVTNNSPGSPAGGGEPLQPYAPDFIPFMELEVRTDGTPGAEVHPNGQIYRKEGHEYVVRVSDVPEGHSFSHWKVTEGNPVIEDSTSSELHLWLNGFDARVEAVFVPQSFSLNTDIDGKGRIEFNSEE